MSKAFQTIISSWQSFHVYHWSTIWISSYTFYQIWSLSLVEGLDHGYLETIPISCYIIVTMKQVEVDYMAHQITYKNYRQYSVIDISTVLEQVGLFPGFIFTLTTSWWIPPSTLSTWTTSCGPLSTYRSTRDRSQFFHKGNDAFVVHIVRLLVVCFKNCSLLHYSSCSLTTWRSGKSTRFYVPQLLLPMTASQAVQSCWWCWKSDLTP